MAPSKLCLLPLCLLSARSAAGAAVGAPFKEPDSRSSPVTRVVGLLESLSKQIEKEQKTEEDLYESFVCWGQSVLSQKAKSNSDAGARIQMLDTYLADLQAGRVELTTERVDLDKELEMLLGDMEVTTELRNRERGEFESAEAEMTQAVAALTSAISVLGSATNNEKEALISVHATSLDSEVDSMKARHVQVQRLQQAAELGDKLLTRGDAVFLRRLLTGEVPTWDWKKLNRKATFKMDYKARSLKIQKVLQELLQTFQGNLADATKKEEDAQAVYDQLMAAKKKQKDAAQGALARMEKENGARGMSQEDTQDELRALHSQVQDDTKFISQVQASLEEKKQQWKERQATRTEELAAISKAISILHSDDARDLMKKSYKSQSFSFLQASSLTSSTATAATVQRAVSALRATASSVKDARLNSILVLAQRAGTPFGEVIQAIDTMLGLLSNEQSEDNQKKEQCESDRAADTRSAALLSRGMDETSDAITKLKATVAELTQIIADKKDVVAKITADLDEATANRIKEHEEFQVATAEDHQAKALVQEAFNVLKTFYSEAANPSFTQVKEPSATVAGEAPPPPPTTWEAPYVGKTEEKEGILGILSIIQHDIEKDIEKTAAEEEAALAFYDEARFEMQTAITNTNNDIQRLSGERGQAETDIGTNILSRQGSGDQLRVVVKRIADSAPFCEFFTVNYPLRKSNRQTEVDGLQKAKIILSGGQFEKAPDSARELKPGDALIGIRRLRASSSA